MIGRLFAGAIVGAIVLFLWGWLWFAVIPFGDAPFSKLPNEAAIVQTMVDAKLEKGTYIYPRMETADAAAMEEWTRQHKQGPLFEVRYHPGGIDPMQAGMMVNGFLHFLLSALIAAALMRMALPMLGSYARRVTFITGLGLFAGIFVNMSGPIWFYYPMDRALSDLLYDTTAWLVAGLAMAAIIKPATPAAAPARAEARESMPA